MENLAVIILAAGKGTRMKSAQPKVLHGFAGRPMLGHILGALAPLSPARTVVVTGFGAEAVEDYCNSNFPGCEFVRQTEQNGTGHAVQVCEPLLGTHQGPIIVLYGDVMLNMRADVLPTLLEAHAANPQGLTLLGATVENPHGLGRLFVQDGHLVNVEEKDCTPEQRAVRTANPGIYMIHGPALWPLLGKLNTNNAQKELYLTDIIGLGATAGLNVRMVEVPADRAEMGVNSRLELAAMDALWQSRKRRELMDSGVTLVGPETCFFAYDTQIGADSVVGPFVTCEAGVTVAENVEIRAYSHLAGCTVGSGALVGPYARIRPGSTLAENVHLGNFVEIKNSTLGKDSKANHLTYIGDADVGSGVNFGAGTITANYNSKTKVKSRTTVGNGVSTGSQTVLVAPVEMGEHSMTGAGTVVRKNIEPFSLVTSACERIVKTDFNKPE